MANNEGYLALFETKTTRGRILYRLYVVSMVVGFWLICIYRVKDMQPLGGSLGYWMGLFCSELWFMFYWFVTQSVRWNPIYRYTNKHALSQRHEKVLPGVDIFVCTADHVIEPPSLVISTVLSLMAYEYPPQKLNVYLSDDGGSELMFYALLEASGFSKHWLPFCRKFKIERRSAAAYFSSVVEPLDDLPMAKEHSLIKKLYEEMIERIDRATKLVQIPEDIRQKHKGFREWGLVHSRHDHPTILQILIDGRDSESVDVEGQPLPTLVYLAREKRPQFHHHFKAGAMNSLIRVSSRISNSPIILNVDCDMYSNNSESVRDALCFFMDEEQSQQIAFVQFPQRLSNGTKNDIYGNCMAAINEVELPGLDSNGGPLYIGTGCFHRRDILCGLKYDKGIKVDWMTQSQKMIKESAHVLEETCKILASCTYEENSQWGQEMGLKYGCPVEDVITGLSIQCRGWKSVYFNPVRSGFLGHASATLFQTLVQHKRWSEGDFQIFLSKYCPFVYGYGKIPLQLQISYSCYLLWAPNCLATLYYTVVPPFCLLRGILLFPKFSSLWILPFAYVMIAKYAYSFGEFIWSAGPIRGWWNDQRMWLYKRLTSYLFGFSEAILKHLGSSKSGFVITAKVAEDDVSERFEKEIMEFGVPSPMFNILATIALFNLLCFAWGIKKVCTDKEALVLDSLAVQLVICGLVVIINMPLYEGLFFRMDKGRMPFSVTFQSLTLAIFACLLALY